MAGGHRQRPSYSIVVAGLSLHLQALRRIVVMMIYDDVEVD